LVFPAVAATCVLEAVEKLLDFVTAASKAQVVCVLKADEAVHLSALLPLQHSAALELTDFVALARLTITVV
jgi:hypothetical protein